ncbi:MAG: AraC family transcriptional regulator [Firmicutes bacterium]|nr:AraC family transcriptional regulator [Bacillota bacterium]
MQTEDYRQKFDRLFDIQLKKTPPAPLPHIHDVYEIMLVLSQGVFCNVNNRRYTVPCGSVLIFNNMDLHGISVEKDASYIRYVTYFQPGLVAHLSTIQTQLFECFLYRPFDTPWLLPLNKEQCSQFRMLLDQTISVQQGASDAYGYDLLLQMRLAELLICVNRFYREYHGLTEEQISVKPFYEMLHYIHRHLEEEITLESLSKQFYLPKRETSRLFRKAAGMSLGEYVVKCRLDRAANALIQGMRVDEVCAKVGFRNLSHFSRTFKKYMELSPKQYARAHKQ